VPVFGAATVDWDSALAGISDTPRVSRENCANFKEIANGHAKAKGPVSHTMASTMSAEALVNAIRAMPKLNARNCDTAFGYDPKWSRVVSVAPLIGNGFCRGPAQTNQVMNPAYPNTVTCLTKPDTAYLECRDMCVNSPSCNCFSVTTMDFTSAAAAAANPYAGSCGTQPRCVMYNDPTHTYALGSLGVGSLPAGRGTYSSFVVHRGTGEHSPDCTTDAPDSLFSICFGPGQCFPCSTWGGTYCSQQGVGVQFTNSPRYPTFMGNQTKSYTLLQLLIANCPRTCAQQGHDACGLLDSIV